MADRGLILGHNKYCVGLLVEAVARMVKPDKYLIVIYFGDLNCLLG